VKLIGKFELGEELGRGGMGVVYRARDPQLKRDVALKLLTTGRGLDAEALQRFEREAQALAALKHPHVVGIHEVGSHAGQPYVVMGLVPGESLAARLAPDQRLEPRAAATLVLALAKAVEQAHRQGILHRDIKPGNVLLNRDLNDHPVLTDFGLARLVSRQTRLTETGTIVGTPGYMPPEQADGNLGQLGPPSDVYALGALLFRLLTGQAPFSGRSTLAILRAILEDPAPPPSSLRPDLDPGLEAICLRCLEKSPGQRYATAASLAADLERWLAGEAVSARGSKAVVLLAPLVLLLGVALVAIVGQPDPPPVPASPPSSSKTPAPPTTAPPADARLAPSEPVLVAASETAGDTRAAFVSPRQLVTHVFGDRGLGLLGQALGRWELVGDRLRELDSFPATGRPTLPNCLVANERYAACDVGRRVLVWDVRRPEARPLVRNLTWTVKTMALASQGDVIAAAVRDKETGRRRVEIRPLSGDPGSEALFKLPEAQGSHPKTLCLAFNAAGDELLVASQLESTGLERFVLRRWRVGSAEPARETVFEHFFPHDLDIHEGWVALASRKQAVLLLPWSALDPPFNPLEHVLAGHEQGQPSVDAFLSKVTPLSHRGSVYQVAFSPRGERLYSVSEYQLRAWDTASRQLLWTVSFEEKRSILQLDVSPDGRLLALGYQGGGLEVWRVPPEQD
jgi:hypothetical protein